MIAKCNIVCIRWATSGILSVEVFISHQKRDIPAFMHFHKAVNPSQYPEDLNFSKFWLEICDCSLSGSLCGKMASAHQSLELMPDIDLMTVSYSISSVMLCTPWPKPAVKRFW